MRVFVEGSGIPDVSAERRPAGLSKKQRGNKVTNLLGGELDRFTRSARLYRKWKQQQPDLEGPELDEDSAEAAATLEEAEESAWSEIENYLTRMNPYDF